MTAGQSKVVRPGRNAWRVKHADSFEPIAGGGQYRRLRQPRG